MPLILEENPGNRMMNVQCHLRTPDSVDRSTCSRFLWLQWREEPGGSTAGLCASVEDTLSISPLPGVKYQSDITNVLCCQN